MIHKTLKILSILSTLLYTIYSSATDINNKSFIKPILADIPRKGETRIDPTTGTRITRLTDASELDESDDALIVYSRYTPENSNGELFLIFGSNSTSSWIAERKTGKIITKLRYDKNHFIGEAHEVRWDTSGKNPYRIYYRNGMNFYSIDNIKKQDETRRLIKDFSTISPNSKHIYNDSEGDSSNDNDHWVWMAVHYADKVFKVDAFIHYQISTDQIDILKPADLKGTPLDHYSNKQTLPKPNMVEVSPLATGIVLHYGRVWGNKEKGNRYKDKNSWFDGAHLWPVDFKYNKKKPSKISVGQTHSGWAFDKSGNEYFISQNNRTDKLDAVKINQNFNQRLEIASHRDLGWSNGFHFGKMPPTKPGWIFLSTYSNIKHKKHNQDWGADQLIMLQLQDINNSPKVIRIAPNYNQFTGKYRDEAHAAINTLGNRIYVSINWGGMLNNREIFLFELAENWHTTYK